MPNALYANVGRNLVCIRMRSGESFVVWGKMEFINRLLAYCVNLATSAWGCRAIYCSDS